jgi:hypothetical protein
MRAQSSLPPARAARVRARSRLIAPRARAIAALACAALLVAGALGSCSAEAASQLELGLLPLGAAGRPVDPNPPLDAERTEPIERSNFHDFGRVPLGEIVTHVFVLENTDRVPVTISHIAPSCGCTTPSVRTQGPDGTWIQGQMQNPDGILRIASGARAELELRIDTRAVQKNNADKHVSVRVVTDSLTRPYLTLEAHIIAETPLQATPTTLDFGQLAAGAGGSARVELLPVGESGLVPAAITSAPPGISARIERGQTAPRETWVVVAELLPPLQPGAIHTRIELELVPRAELGLVGVPRPDVPAARRFELPVHAQIVPDLGLEPVQLALVGERGKAASGSSTLRTRLPGHRVLATRVQLNGPLSEHLSATLEAEAPDAAGRAASWIVRLEASPDFPTGFAAGKGSIEIDDAQYPRVEFEWIVRLGSAQ